MERVIALCFRTRPRFVKGGALVHTRGGTLHREPATEPSMIKPVRTCALAMLSTAALGFASTWTPSARAETWCVRQFGDPPGRQVCTFSSAEECLRAVFIGGSGICGRQRLPRWVRPTALDERMWSNPHRLTAW
jgi:hypothetical protein